MDYSQYQQQRAHILSSQFPYKVIDKAELLSRGHNIIELNGQEIPVTPTVQSSIDRFVGITSPQIKAVESSFGAKGIRDLRNYFALAGNSDNPDRIALIANPTSRTIEGTTFIRREVISPEAFFDFAEMFMDKNDFYPQSIRTGQNGTFGVEITMKPRREEFGGFSPDDEFLKNGLFLKWNLAGIEMGNYIERLICVNGATRVIPHKEASVFDLTPKSANKLLAIPENKKLINLNWEKHLDAAVIAHHTEASLAEVKHANRLLIGLGVEPDIAEEIAPIAMLLGLYISSGLNNVHNNGKIYKSNINFWELYNRLTHFASHTQLWSDNDIRRNILMNESMDFLTKKRDITEYISIFD